MDNNAKVVNNDSASPAALARIRTIASVALTISASTGIPRRSRVPATGGKTPSRAAPATISALTMFQPLSEPSAESTATAAIVFAAQSPPNSSRAASANGAEDCASVSCGSVPWTASVPAR